MSGLRLPLQEGPSGKTSFYFISQVLNDGQRHKRPAGLFLTAIVWIVYSIALRYEGYVSIIIRTSRGLPNCSPFTTEIYAKRERERALKAQKTT